MQHFRILLLQFYKPFWWYHLLFSLIGIYTILRYGLEALPITVLFKLTGYASSFGYQYYFNKHVYHYYRNADFAIRTLYVSAFGCDFLAFLILTTLGLYISSHFHA